MESVRVLDFGFHATIIAESAAFVKYIITITISPSQINFGAVVEGERPKATAWIENHSSKSIPISSVLPSCGCTTPDIGSAKYIPAGSRIPLSVTFNSRGRPGPIDKYVIVFTKNPKLAVQLGLTGQVQRQLAILPLYLNMGDVRFGYDSLRTISLTRVDGKNLKVLKIGANPDLKVNIHPQTPTKTMIDVSVLQSSRVGDHNTSLQIFTNLPAEPVANIPVNYTIIGPLKVTPPQLTFGLVETNVSKAATVFLSGPRASLATVAWCPSGVTAKIKRFSKNKVLIEAAYKFKGGHATILNSNIKLRTENSLQPNVSIPVYAAIYQ